MQDESGRTRAPATRDQVEAYRFGLRRLESALVRGDPVPMHEQLRGQRRAALAGVALGMLALAGVAVYAALVPAPDWRAQSVVTGAQSGAMYVVAHDPDRLVPVANLSAGRLVLAALGAGDPGSAEPVAVDDAALDAAPRTATAAMAGATSVRLDGAVPPRWAVCDEAGPDGPRTTVVGGALPVAAGASDAVLVTVPGGSTWLLTGGHRHRVDPGDRPVLVALGMAGRSPRAASAALVTAIPEGPELATPRVPGAGADAPGSVPGRVGDVLLAENEAYVVLAAGVQRVPPLVGEVLRSAGADVHEIGPAVLAAAAPADLLDVRGWPAAMPLSVDAPVLCWTWAADGDPAGAVGVAAALPSAVAPVALVQADGPGRLADAVALDPAGGGAVRATGPGRAPGTGPLWLVAATGVAFGVADEATAAALGVGAAAPAPEAALRLLPVGPTLDVADARRLLDVPPAGG